MNPLGQQLGRHARKGADAGSRAKRRGLGRGGSDDMTRTGVSLEGGGDGRGRYILLFKITSEIKMS